MDWPRRGRDRVPADVLDARDRDRGSRSTESRALRPGPLEPRQHPFSDAFSLELRDGAEDVHLQRPGRRRRVDSLVERHERDPERLQFLEQRD